MRNKILAIVIIASVVLISKECFAEDTSLNSIFKIGKIFLSFKDDQNFNNNNIYNINSITINSSNITNTSQSILDINGNIFTDSIQLKSNTSWIPCSSLVNEGTIALLNISGSQYYYGCDSIKWRRFGGY